MRLLLCNCGLVAQSKNIYRFIEPNIPITYDSTRFKTGEIYSNSDGEKTYERIDHAVIVTVKQPLQHKVIGAELIDGGMRQIFSSEDGKSVRVKCRSRETGKIIRKGDLVIANSFGKKVRKDFTISYDK